MRRELILQGAFVKDAKKGVLYEVIGREASRVTLLDVSSRTNPAEETVSWLIGTAESRLQYVQPAPDWDGIASEAEWGRGG